MWLVGSVLSDVNVQVLFTREETSVAEAPIVLTAASDAHTPGAHGAGGLVWCPDSPGVCAVDGHLIYTTCQFTSCTCIIEETCGKVSAEESVSFIKKGLLCWSPSPGTSFSHCSWQGVSIAPVFPCHSTCLWSLGTRAVSLHSYSSLTPLARGSPCCWSFQRKSFSFHGFFCFRFIGFCA